MIWYSVANSCQCFGRNTI